jgi:hypothetical protein
MNELKSLHCFEEIDVTLQCHMPKSGIMSTFKKQMNLTS